MPQAVFFSSRFFFKISVLIEDLAVFVIEAQNAPVPEEMIPVGAHADDLHRACAPLEGYEIESVLALGSLYAGRVAVAIALPHIHRRAQEVKLLREGREIKEALED